VLLVALTPILVACPPSRGEFNELKSRVAQLERRQGGLDEQVATEMRRLENLRLLVEEATALLQRNGARLNAKLDGQESDLRVLTGKLEEAVHTVDRLVRDMLERRKEAEGLRQDLEALRTTLRDRAGIAELALPKDLPSDAKGMLAEADKRLKIDDVLTARAICRELIKRHGGTTEAHEARILLGDTYAAEKRFPDAIKEYQAVHDALQAKGEAPLGKALLHIGEALEAKKDCRKALDVYRYLAGTFRKLPEAKTAAERIKDAKKRCK
jgi:TolA-binding protein